MELLWSRMDWQTWDRITFQISGGANFRVQILAVFIEICKWPSFTLHERSMSFLNPKNLANFSLVLFTNHADSILAEQNFFWLLVRRQHWQTLRTFLSTHPQVLLDISIDILHMDEWARLTCENWIIVSSPIISISIFLSTTSLRRLFTSWHLTHGQLESRLGWQGWTLENFSSPLSSCGNPLLTDCLHRLFVSCKSPARDSHTILWPLPPGEIFSLLIMHKYSPKLGTAFQD